MKVFERRRQAAQVESDQRNLASEHRQERRRLHIHLARARLTPFKSLELGSPNASGREPQSCLSLVFQLLIMQFIYQKIQLKRANVNGWEL